MLTKREAHILQLIGIRPDYASIRECELAKAACDVYRHDYNAVNWIKNQLVSHNRAVADPPH